MTYTIGLATTFHDPAIAIVGPDGEVLFAEAAERYLQYKRAPNCEPDTTARMEALLRRYIPRGAEIRLHDPDAAVRDLVPTIIRNEHTKITERKEVGRASQFDSLRMSATTSALGAGSLSQEVTDSLVTVCNAVLETSTGRSWFTMGILRDVVMAIVMAQRDPNAELVALGNAVADKIVHQLRGNHSDAQLLLEAIASLPNADEIARLFDQVLSGPSDELLPLL